MELKNALTVCLISLFSATLVLLIARTLDVQSAARLEPQLARIAEELESLRKQGGITAAVSAAPHTSTSAGADADALHVYYFHSNTRCPTCRNIESQAHDFVHTELAAELDSGQVAWKVLNYEDRSGADLAKQFDIQYPIVVLAKLQGGEMVRWKNLDGVWGLVGDKPGYAAFMRDEVNKMLGRTEPQPPADDTNGEP